MKVKEFLKKHKLAIGIVITIVLLWLCFREIDFEKVWQTLLTIKFYYILLAIACMFVLYLLKGIRWKFLIDPIQKVPTIPVISSMMCGYFAHNIFPLRLGEFMRVYYLRKKEDVNPSALFGSILAEKLFDGLSLFIMAFLSIFLNSSDKNSSISSSALLLLILLLIALSLYVTARYLPKRPAKYVKSKLFAVLKGEYYKKTILVFRKLFHGFRSLHSFKTVFIATFISILVWIADLFSIYFVLLAFNVQIDHLFLKCLIPLVIINLGIMVPSGPGDSGMFHLVGKAAFVAILLAPNASELAEETANNLAAAITLILHFITILPGFTLGTFLVIKNHVKIDLKAIKASEKQ